MSQFRRMLRWLFFLSGFLTGIIGAIAIFFRNRLVSPPREYLWATPGDLNLAYEEANFPAKDGVQLAGWFVPADSDSRRKGATILLAHGWLWNRLGISAEDALSNIIGATPVDLLRLAYSLHKDGYHIFMFDSRNHGESAAAPPVTFGWQEAEDILGALEYLNGRSDVDSQQIGAIGFSAGANALLYALPQTDQIQAVVLVQPTTISHFARRFAANLAGPLGSLALSLTEILYRAAGGPPFSALNPSFPASQSGDTPILFIQGRGDPWGSTDDVSQMATVSPQARGPLFVDSVDRFGGYQYAVDNPKILTAFFEQHLPE